MLPFSLQLALTFVFCNQAYTITLGARLRNHPKQVIVVMTFIEKFRPSQNAY